MASGRPGSGFHGRPLTEYRSRHPRACSALVAATRNGTLPACFRLQWKDGAIRTTELPELPKPCAFMSGALAGRIVYVVGGIERADATRCLQTVWSLDLDDPHGQWRTVEPLPGPGAHAGGCGFVGRIAVCLQRHAIVGRPPGDRVCESICATHGGILRGRVGGVWRI